MQIYVCPNSISAILFSTWINTLKRFQLMIAKIPSHFHRNGTARCAVFFVAVAVVVAMTAKLPPPTIVDCIFLILYFLLKSKFDLISNTQQLKLDFYFHLQPFRFSCFVICKSKFMDFDFHLHRPTPTHTHTRSQNIYLEIALEKALTRNG